MPEVHSHKGREGYPPPPRYASEERREGGGKGLAGGREGCAIKAEGVCRLVLPGVCMCAPFEEGILHLWNRWVGCPPVGLGVRREGSENLREVGSQLGYLTARGGRGSRKDHPPPMVAG